VAASNIPDPEIPAQRPNKAASSLLPVSATPGKLVRMPVRQASPRKLPPGPRLSARVLVTVILLLVLIVLGCGVYLGETLWQATQTATITLVPRTTLLRQHITVLAVTGRPSATQVPARRLFAQASTLSATVPATGTGQQSARVATGSLTLYNLMPQVQYVPAGSQWTTKNGVQVMILVQAAVPAGTGPLQGQITVSARAVYPGADGNIPTEALYAAQCCDGHLINGIVASNLQPFLGGQDAQSYALVRQQDINAAADPLMMQGKQAAQNALTEQIRDGEQLVQSTVSCLPTIQSHPGAGSRASAVTVHVLVSCGGEVYITPLARQLAIGTFLSKTESALGPSYLLVGTVTVGTAQITTQDAIKGTLAITLPLQARWEYRIDRKAGESLLSHLSGASMSQAHDLFMHLAGVASVTISGTGENSLPQESSHIHLIIQAPPSI